LAEYHDGIFTTPYHSTRDEIQQQDLDDIPFVSPNGSEISLFSNDGFKIQRRTALFNRHVKPHGVLVDLQSTKNLFTNNDSDDMQIEDDQDPPSSDFSVYPQAGLKSAGHFQAKNLIAGCYPIIRRINRYLNRHRPHHRPSHDSSDSDDMQVDDDNNNNSDNNNDHYILNRPVVQGIASQGYNALMHHTRGRTAQHHEVQVGQVTAALAGIYATTPQHTNRARKLTRSCQQALPHQAFAEKILSEAITTDLRLENIYSIDIKALAPVKRNGRTLLEDILLPLSSMWQHGDLLNRLKKSVVLFKPEVNLFPSPHYRSPFHPFVPFLLHRQAFPQIYNWTSYPLTCAIESLFQQASSNNAISKKDPFLVEICSVAERALNYLHTGNAAVIATSVMNPLWIGRALIQDGLPCLNPRYVVTSHGSRLKPLPETWPYNKKKHQPLSSSKRAQVLTYGESYFNASTLISHFQLYIIIITFIMENTSRKCAVRTSPFGALQRHSLACLYHIYIYRTKASPNCAIRTSPYGALQTHLFSITFFQNRSLIYSHSHSHSHIYHRPSWLI
jgi:hypothetical protein